MHHIIRVPFISLLVLSAYHNRIVNGEINTVYFHTTHAHGIVNAAPVVITAFYGARAEKPFPSILLLSASPRTLRRTLNSIALYGFQRGRICMAE